MSDFLFAQPSLATGLGRCLDIGGVFDEYNISRTSEEADAKALYSDFRAVGADLLSAAKQVAAEGRE